MSLFEPFLANSVIKDRRYSIVRDNVRYKEQKRFLEKLWAKFCPFADSSFKTNIALDFHACFWEMYLACAFLDFGFELTPRGQHEGPDLKIRDGDSIIWVEAVVITSGTEVDAVPQFEITEEVVEEPTDKMLLRLTNAISRKKKQLEQHQKKGIVGENDAYIIAVNGFQVFQTFSGDEIPYIVQSVFPFGDIYNVINVMTMEILDAGYKYRDKIIKKSGALVSTKAFLEDSFSGVSGILYSGAELWNLPEFYGSDFVFVHNLMANSKLQHDWMPMGISYWVEEDKLKKQLILNNH